MKLPATLLALALCISCALAATCVGNASVVPRTSGGSWSDATYNYQIYDIALNNPGSCGIDSFAITFSFTPSNSSITDFWNMELDNGKWIINAQTLHVSQGPMLPVGYSYPASVGFTLRFLKSSSTAAVSLQFTVVCNSCGGATSAPTPAPTTMPTTIPTTSTSGSGPTPSPTSAPTDAPSTTCSATALLIARSGSAWTDGNNNFQVYDISVTNNGRCALDIVRLQFLFSSGASITQSWNLVQQGTIWILGTTTLGIANGHWLAPGQTSSGAAGFILMFPATANYVLSVRVNVQSATCVACSTPPTPPPTSGGPTPPPTPPPSGKCRVTASVSRDTSIAPWVSNGHSYAVYRILVTNVGVCPMSALTMTFSPISVTSSWNLQPVIGGYMLQNFGPSIAANGVFNGAGFVLADVVGPISVLSSSVTCLPC